MNYQFSNSGGSQPQHSSTGPAPGGAMPPPQASPPASFNQPAPAANPNIPPVPAQLKNQPGSTTPPTVPNANPEQGTPDGTVPTAVPQVNPELDTLKKQLSDKDRYIQQLTKERNLSYETIEQKTQQIEHLEQKIQKTRSHMQQIAERSKNPNLPLDQKNYDLQMYNMLRSELNEAQSQVNNINNDRQTYENIMSTAYQAKQPHIEQEIIEVCNKYGAEQGGAENVWNFIQTQVFPMTNDPQIMEQYLLGQITVEDMYNHVYAPRRSISQKLFNKQNFSIPNSGVNPNPATPPQTPAMPARRKFFS